MQASLYDASTVQSALHVVAHLAVWAGLYVAGAVVCVSQVAGIDAIVPIGTRTRAAAFAFCTAMAVYLLDRVKTFDSWLDPADAQAHPARFAFLAQHSTRVRVLILLLLTAAVCLGKGLSAWAAAVPVLAVAGVLVYAARPRTGRPRPKDIVLLKNAYVAAGITGFAVVVAIAAVHPGAGLRIVWEVAVAHAVPLSVSCAHLAMRVFADAVLCDLDDEDADRRHGTSTLPTHLGRTRAWNTALAVRLCIALGLVLIPVLPAPARLAWAAVTVVSSVSLRLAAPVRVRDWVDARLPMETACVAVILVLWRSFAG
ncbi:MAG: hypothetical protein IT435_15720 [Phycisphaerales bacterium]|nr:hypothetical protein [Phycisphaerales bacterium]